MANLVKKVAWIGSKWPILVILQAFLYFPLKSANFLNFSTFSNRFTPMRLKMTHNGKFGQKSGLDWVKTAKCCHFAGFSIFSPKMRLRLTWNGQFHLINNFPHLLPLKPKHLIFGEISKIFISSGGDGGGVHQPEPKCHIDLRFQLFHYKGGIHRQFF